MSDRRLVAVSRPLPGTRVLAARRAAHRRRAVLLAVRRAERAGVSLAPLGA